MRDLKQSSLKKTHFLITSPWSAEYAATEVNDDQWWWPCRYMHMTSRLLQRVNILESLFEPYQLMEVKGHLLCDVVQLLYRKMMMVIQRVRFHWKGVSPVARPYNEKKGASLRDFPRRDQNGRNSQVNIIWQDIQQPCAFIITPVIICFVFNRTFQQPAKFFEELEFVRGADGMFFFPTLNVLTCRCIIKTWGNSWFLSHSGSTRTQL